MKITNKYNLPSSIVRAIEQDPYDPGESDITITSLIDSPQIRLLYKKHKDAVSQDASDMVWQLFGQAVHHILERGDADQEEIVTEQRLYIDVLGMKVGAKFDRIRVIAPFVMQDYKCTSAWTLVFGDRVKEWEKQLNCQAHVARANGYQITSLEIVAILRDWSATQAAKGGDYPDRNIVTLPIPVWSDAQCQKYMEERVAIHQKAEADGFAFCSDDERWYNGKKKTFARCDAYCPLKAVCPQLLSEAAI